MANDISGNPLIIDTAAATNVWPQGGNLNVRHFEFVDYAAGTDNVIVTDRNGRRVWSANGTADLDNIISQEIGWIRGLIVPTLSSGKLYVYLF